MNPEESPEDCLPPELRTSTTALTRMAAGLSGARVYRVDAAGGAFVLKVTDPHEPLAAWRRKVDVQRLAADAGLAPRIAHIDEARRAVVSRFVDGSPFPKLYGDPRTHEAALVKLGQTVRRVHELPLPADAEPSDPRGFLDGIWSGLVGRARTETPRGVTFAVPRFVREVVEGVLAEAVPAREHALVLSHNDLNPMNLMVDGEQLSLLDWDTAGPNDPLYDLATVSVFLRMDEPTCGRLLAAYHGRPTASLSEGFGYNRRMVAALVGVLFLHLARTGGHPGATGAEALETTPSLGDVYQRMRSGKLDPATSEGQWDLGLSLMKTSAELPRP
jgi:aminoglycoside phosphotransferase (APT) family kinase protein